MTRRSDDRADTVRAYHHATKHHPQRYARSLGYMDWATQPDPFRRYEGAQLVPLAIVEPGADPPYDRAFERGSLPPAPLDRRSLSTFFLDALGLSAWKEYGDSRWALRVNPSSGNLHPTEGYALLPQVGGLLTRPSVCHYAPHEHALELRAALPDQHFREVTAGLPDDCFLFALTSIHWRESWKYGERAFRYCQHDAGHAIASVAIAAAGLGWEARVIAPAGDAEIAGLFGVASQQGVEAEHPDVLILIGPPGADFDQASRSFESHAIGEGRADRLAGVAFAGTPNKLSASHHEWEAIVAVAEAAAKPRTSALVPAAPNFAQAAVPRVVRDLSLRRIIHQRRSAVALDGVTGLDAQAFYRILEQTLPRAGRIPFTSLPYPVSIHLALFVHRVRGVEPGLYFLLRDPAAKSSLMEAMDRRFRWEKGTGFPQDLPFYLLHAGDYRGMATSVSCGQDIAGNGAFALGMIAHFDERIESFGPWYYRVLHFEAGLVGQVLYLEAEAAGIRATGIGCFFDDVMHGVLGLSGAAFQTLYHFTMGGPVEDQRLRTHPAYAHLSGRGPARPLEI